MSEEIEILDYIYQNSKICQETIVRIIKKQYLEYKKVSNSAKNMLERRKKKVKEEINVMGKIVTYMEIKRNIEKDDRESEIALLLIEGSKVGLEQTKERLNDIKIVNKPVLNLVNRLINLEKSNINELSIFVEKK